MQPTPHFSTLSIEQVSAHLHTDPQQGLSSHEAQARLKQGRNELPKAKPFSTWLLFLNQFTNPLIYFLMAGAAIAGFLGEWIQMGAIGAILILNAIISFFQEYSAERSFEALQTLYVPTSKVIRKGTLQTISSQEIVPGDLVLLEAGDQVPADGRILYTAQLTLQEATLTGESTPVHKDIKTLPSLPIADQKNMAFAGTQVAGGKGTMLVTSTGPHTELGKIASSLQQRTKEPTPLQIRFHKLGKQLIVLCLAIVVLIFIIGLLRSMSMLNVALTSISLAVAAIPEGLPAIVTVTLAVGVRRMARRNTLIRRLASVETLGCTSVICTDKTGTLTKNEMTVLHYWIHQNTFDVTGTGYEPKGTWKQHNQPIDLTHHPELLFALKIGVLCNNANLHDEQGEWKIAGDPTEGALLVAAAKANLWKQDLEKKTTLIGEIPFDSDRKRMSMLRSDGYLYVKGALETVLPLCSSTLQGEKPFDQEVILQAQYHLASQGFRVLALAYKETNLSTEINSSLEQDLTFVGLVAMMDPPRDNVKEAILACQAAHVMPVMITGDHKETAIAIAKQIGLLNPDQQAIEGKELDCLSEKEFEKNIAQFAVFARVNAQHKLRIIEAWKKQKQVVGMTGDGVNDALAIKRADIGIAMGITGTEVTKQVSDMVILDDHFATIVSAIQEGRAIYKNILKFVHFLLSANFAELLVIFFGILWGFTNTLGEAVPILLPVQILWINFVTDGLPAIALAFDPIEKGAMNAPPRKISESILSFSWGIQLLLIGVIASIGALIAAYLGFQESSTLGETMAFTELVLLEMGILFLIRLPLSPFSNPYVLAAVLFSLLLQLLVIYTPSLQLIFNTQNLYAKEWLQLVSLAIGVNLAVFLILFLFKKSFTISKAKQTF